MIEINLLPDGLKRKPRKPGIDLESKETLYFIPLAFVVLIIIHILLAATFIFQNMQSGILNKRWQRMESQRKALENFRSESAQLSGDAAALQQINAKSIKWAPKLNKLSLDLPAGIWFRSISIVSGMLDIRASVISLQKSEMNVINQFLDNLKKDNDFFADFTKLDLNSLEKKAIGGYEIADFNLAGTLKEK